MVYLLLIGGGDGHLKTPITALVMMRPADLVNYGLVAFGS